MFASGYVGTGPAIDLPIAFTAHSLSGGDLEVVTLRYVL